MVRGFVIYYLILTICLDKNEVIILFYLKLVYYIVDSSFYYNNFYFLKAIITKSYLY